MLVHLVLLVTFLWCAQFCTSSNKQQPAFADGYHKPNRNEPTYDERRPIGQSYVRDRNIPGKAKVHSSTRNHYTSSSEFFGDGTNLQRSQNIAQSNLDPNPLLKQASTASVCLLFGLLVWRSLSSYELAEQFLNEYVRLMSIIPVVGILIANITGFVVNLAKPLNFKTHLKVILAVNVLREWIEMAYNVLMLIASSPTSATPREAYFGRLFMNVWWSLLCFSFSKSRWVLLQQSESPQTQRPGRF